MMHGFGLSFMFLGFLGTLAVIGVGSVLFRQLNRRGTGLYREPLRDPRSVENSNEADIFRLARKLGGRLTVSDVVIHLGYRPRDAEQMLEKMTDSIRVRMEVTENGMIVYDFFEVDVSDRGNGSQNERT